MPPRLARLLALLVAVALVAGAFVLRGALTDGRDPDGPAGGGPDRGPAGGVAVLCDADLAAACLALGGARGVASVEVLEAGPALDRLAAGDLAADLWLTLDPWPGLLAVARRSGGPAGPDVAPVPVASAELALLALQADDLGCGPVVAWTCLARAAVGRNVGVPDRRTATGTLVLGAAAAGLVGATDFGIGAVRSDPEVSAPLSDLLASGRPGPAPAQADRMRAQRGSYHAVVAPRPVARRQAESAQGRAFLEVRPFAVPVTLGVVLAPLTAAGARTLDDVAGAVTEQTGADALAAAGWDGPAAPSRGLPDPDVLYALRKDFG